MTRRRHPPKKPPQYQTAMIAKYYAPPRTIPTAPPSEAERKAEIDLENDAAADEPVNWLNAC